MLHLGVELALRPRRARRSKWSPATLGADLLGLWDAERGDLITRSGGAVSSWKDSVAGHDLVQAIGAMRPVYGAAAFNGRAGIGFDGVDDHLSLESMPFPSGAAGSELWAVVEQTAAASDANVRYAVAYGGNSTSLGRTIARNASASRLTVRTGSGGGSLFASPGSTTFIGRRTVRCIVSPTTTTGVIDDAFSSSVAVIPATGTTRVRMGAQLANTATQFWQGQIAMLAITAPLADPVALEFARYCLARSS